MISRGGNGGWAGGPGKLPSTSMDAKTKLKAKLPSRHVTEGPERAPHRSYYYAMGLTTGQIHQPFVGVASCWNEAAPCNIALMRQAHGIVVGAMRGALGTFGHVPAGQPVFQLGLGVH